MYNTLLNLEKSFFKLQYISDRNWLERILHDDFHECGKSGLLFGKEETVESLIKCTSDRNIVIYNFDYRTITDNSWLAHYITESDNKQYYRTSLWVEENKTIKLLFHQATELKKYKTFN